MDAVKPRRLTKKQRGFVKDYVMTGNGTESALANYEIGRVHGTQSPEVVAASIATENLKKPQIAEAVEKGQQTLKSALEKQGVTPEKIAKKIDQLLDDEDGTNIDKGLKHATAIYGVEDAQKPVGNNSYTFIFNSETQQEIKKMEAVIKAKLLNHAPKD